MNLQDVTFPIELSIPEAESILKGLAHLPKMEADPIFAKVQQTALQAIQKVQSQPVVEVSPTEQFSTAQAQAAIDQAEANSDSMKGE
jgi:hypothetical protein